MEPNYGIISVIPAVVVIGLALYTKKTVLSLVIGTFLGVTILNGWNPLVAVVSLFQDYLYPNLTSTGNLKTIIIIIVLQGYVKNAETHRRRRVSLQVGAEMDQEQTRSRGHHLCSRFCLYLYGT